MRLSRIIRLASIVGITSLAALWMYIDRVCFSTLADPAQKDLGITDDQKGVMLGAFFFTYALFQIPMGTLADVFGQRLVLTLSIAAWSVVTALTGFVEGFFTLLVVRLLLGITESGAYPAAAGLVKNWAPAGLRGLCSSFVALGGRVGGAIAPLLTAWLAVELTGVALGGGGANPSGVNWRGVFVVYGLCGLGVAGLFWLIVRNRRPAPTAAAEAPADPPADWHALPPRAAEHRLVAVLRSLLRLATSRNMWLFGALQFGVNVGWAFLITLFPSYLNEVFDVPLAERGRMQTVVLVTGCVGMLLGGMVTDLVRALLGPRYGRSVPIAAALTGCAVALFLVPSLASVWLVVFTLGAMAFLVDMHNPSIWAFAQDVGGKSVGAALGWGNMWGNLGAALSPVLLIAVKTAAGWDAAFVVGGVAFVLAAVCGLLLDATKPVEADV